MNESTRLMIKITEYYSTQCNIKATYISIVVFIIYLLLSLIVSKMVVKKYQISSNLDSKQSNTLLQWTFFISLSFTIIPTIIYGAVNSLHNKLSLQNKNPIFIQIIGILIFGLFTFHTFLWDIWGIEFMYHKFDTRFDNLITSIGQFTMKIFPDLTDYYPYCEVYPTKELGY